MTGNEQKSAAPQAFLPSTAVEQELEHTESKIAAILAIAADAIIALDGKLRITQFNDGAEAIFGYAKDEVVGRSLDTLIPERFRRAHLGHVETFAASGVAARRMGQRQEIYALRKDGGEFPAEASIAQLRLGDECIYMVLLRDVTERKRTEALLERSNLELEARVAERTRALEEEIRRREEAQAALIQAQRMEAFGQLTGGVAHDFNNLLTIVLGNLERLDPGISGSEPRDYLRRAADAAQMGARLTSRLMSFARRRPLAPTVLNLNELVLGIAELLKRSLGDKVMLTTVLDSALWSTRADPSEFENAVLNLAINGRDAMPRGGKLVIETSNLTIGAGSAAGAEDVPPGDYVRLAVSDTGVGMSPEVMQRAFEPFFTTKEGRGTGLGLSTVYGFGRQSGGHVTIESEVGSGTRVSVLLPRDSGSATAMRGEGAERVPMAENAETVLVVEDDPAVRELALKRVEGLGYVALEAGNAAAAIEILETVPEVALVFSDIGLGPGMSGAELGQWVRTHRPATKVVLTTGYDSDAVAAHEAGERFVVLNKPYSRYQLAVALDAALREAGA
jgi:PAS domain S-box-containing protein